MSSKSKKIAGEQRPKVVQKPKPPYELFAKLQLRREQLIGEVRIVEQQMNGVRAQIRKLDGVG